MTPIYHFIIAFVVIRSVAVVVVTVVAVVGNGLAKVVVSRIDFDVVVAAGDVNIGLKSCFLFLWLLLASISSYSFRVCC